MNGKQLKNSILQWAIQGKLVPQDPNDEPASVLLERIREEKERLIKEKKIKRDKNASVIFRGEDNSYYEKMLATGEVKCIDEEIPFDVPNGWEWCRLRDISIIQEGPGIRSFQYTLKGVQLLTVTNILEGAIDLNKSKKCISNEEYVSKYLHFQLTKGDIVCACSGGSWGKSAVFNIDNKQIILNTSTLRLRFFGDLGCNTFLYNITKSSFFKLQLAEQLSGIQPNFGYAHYSKVLIPLPPLNEQERIVAKFAELSPQIDKYSKAQDSLDKLNNSIKVCLEKSILQEAIQGKLVPQIAKEGSAQELLDQIRSEKQKLVKEGKLKKSALNDTAIFRGDDNKYYEQIGKKCLDITEQIPFDLPESWSWARGMSVFMPMESTKPSSDFVYIDVDAVNNRLNIIDNPKKVRFENAPSRATRKLHKNDLLFSMVRPYLKNIALVDDIYIDAIASTGFYVITPSLGYYPMFLFYLMLSNYVVDGLNAFMKGDNSPSINNCHIEDYLYPLPPIEEQKRIVNKIEQLFKQLR